MQQKIIVDTSIWDFQRNVKQYLNDGWKVIPGTQVATLHDIERGPVQERYIVFLEKND